MAFEKLGFLLTIDGVDRFVSDIQRVNSSIARYQANLIGVQKAILSNASAEERAAKTVVKAVQSSLNQITTMTNTAKTSILRQITELTIPKKGLTIDTKLYNKSLNSILAMTNSFSLKIRGALLTPVQTKNVSDAFKGYVEALNKVKLGTGTIAQAKKEYDKLVASILKVSGAEKQRKDLLKDLATATKDFADAQAKTIASQIKSQSLFQNINTIISVLNGNFKKTLPVTGDLANKLNLFALKTAAVSVALSGVQLVIGGVRAAFGILSGVVSAVGGVFNWAMGIVKGIASSLWNLATGALKLVWQGFVKLVSIPFNFLRDAFSSLFNLIKNVITISLGIDFNRFITDIVSKIKELGGVVFEAAGYFQVLEVRMRGLLAREYVESGVVSNFNDGLQLASQNAKELLKWISLLAIKSPFTGEEVAKTFTLAMSYGFTSEEAKKLTKSIVDFAAGMGVENDVITRIIENFGQMVMAGKVTGTELRDLARGAFLPNSRIFAIMAQNLGITTEQAVKMTPALAKAAQEIKDLAKFGDSEGMYVKEFIAAFQQMVERDFPNAAERMIDTWQVATSNVRDFFELFIGGLGIKPALDVISARVSKFVNLLVNEKNYDRMTNVGKSIAIIVENIFKLSDILSGDISLKIDGIFSTMEKAFKMMEDLFTGLNTFVPETFMVNGVTKFSMGKNKRDLSKFYEDILKSGWFDVNFVESYIKPLVNKLEQGDWSGAFQSMKEMMYEKVLPGIGASIGDFVTKKIPELAKILFGGLKAIWDYFTTDLWPTISPQIGDWFSAQFEAAKPAIGTKLQEIGNEILKWASSQDGVLGRVAKFIGEITKALGLDVGGVTGGVSEEIASQMPSDISANISRKTSGNLSKVIKSTLDEIASTINSWASNNSGLAGTVYRTVAGVFEALSLYFGGGSNVDYSNWPIDIPMPKKTSIADTIKNTIDKIVGYINTLNNIDLSNLNKQLDPLLKFVEELGNILTILQSVVKIAESLGNISMRLIFLPQEIITKMLGFGSGLKLPGVDAGSIATFMAGLATAVEGIKTKIFEILDTAIGYVTRFKDDWLKVMSDTSWATELEWRNLDITLVSRSIIPDMMDKIIDVVTTSMYNLIILLGAKIIELEALFNVNNMKIVGENYMQGLYEGMLSKWKTIKDWFEREVKPVLNVVNRAGSSGSGTREDKNRASGGIVYPGRGYIVGESAFTRPEFFVPSVSGYILTKQDAMKSFSNMLYGQSFSPSYISSGMQGSMYNRSGGTEVVNNTNIYNTLDSKESISLLAYEVAREIKRRSK